MEQGLNSIISSMLAFLSISKLSEMKERLKLLLKMPSAMFRSQISSVTESINSYQTREDLLILARLLLV